MTPQQGPDSATDRAQQREREEMFSFHPEILGEAGEMPRRLDGSTYTTEPRPRMPRRGKDR